MVKSVGVYEARTQLAKLVDRAEQGDVTVLTRNGRPVAELRPLSRTAEAASVVDEILELDWTLGASLVETLRDAREERG